MWNNESAASQLRLKVCFNYQMMGRIINPPYMSVIYIYQPSFQWSYISAVWSTLLWFFWIHRRMLVYNSLLFHYWSYIAVFFCDSVVLLAWCWDRNNQGAIKWSNLMESTCWKQTFMLYEHVKTQYQFWISSTKWQIFVPTSSRLSVLNNELYFLGAWDFFVSLLGFQISL